MKVNSVLGPIAVEDLGTTLIHEHLGIGWPGWELDHVDFDRKKEGKRIVDKLKEIRDLGIKSFVDPCPMELGRDPEFSAEMSDKSGIQIVIATGLYNDALGIPQHFRLMDIDGIAEQYVSEIKDGIGKTGIKAGIIKTASGGIHGVTPPGQGIKETEVKCLRAAARASKATGAPILCHNDEMDPYGRETLDIFEDEKVDFNKVLIGHACGVGDMRYYFDILERGAWLGFDRFGIESIASDKLRLASLLGLLAVGYDRIMLSHDTLQCWRGRDTGVLDSMAAASPNWDVSHISRNILPAMRKAGVTDDKIDTLMVKNPCSYFGTKKRKKG
ncbi:MAG: phosphotriesterase [Gammaproteobacteria bacterium]|nr:phosphotriesterase [Gammaproteobacteria bacterium]MBK9428463.1 phosphotriesterase [Gammaproteobacteria bacterium]